VNLPTIPEFISLQPVVLITGFLGSGKTTLLKKLLSATKESGITSNVILNDYVDASVDSSTLQEFTDHVEPLTATCACCEGLDFLLDLSIASSKSSSDILFIELNGTADPVPIIESFTLLEDKLQLHPRWQICVIDVRHFGKRETYSDIEELQLQTASHIYFSHHDSDEVPEQVLKTIKSINPHVSIMNEHELTHAILKLSKRTNKAKLNAPSKDLFTKNTNISEKHQKTHEFTSCKILMPHHASEETIQHWLRALPADVIRAKLLIRVTDWAKNRYLFERVASEISKYPQKVRLNDSVQNSAILIGPDLNITELKQLTDACFS